MKVDFIQAIAASLNSREVVARAVEPGHSSGYPHSQLQITGLAILCLFPTMAFVVWGLRMFGRFATKQYGWDDLLVTIAMALSIAETGSSFKSMRTAFIGVHYADIPPDADLVEAQKWNFTSQILYNPILALVKTSVLLFLLRLGGQKYHVRVSIIALIVFNLLLMVSIFIVCIVQCLPVNYFWLRSSPTPPTHGSCINQDAFYIITGGLTILTDVLSLALPFWIFVGLKLPWRVRGAIIGVFTLGAGVTVMSILRLVWLIQTSYGTPSKDPTYDIRYVFSGVETNLAIMTASAPALRPLFLKWFPNFFSALKSSNKYQKYFGYGQSQSQYALSAAKQSRNRNTMTSNGVNGSYQMKNMTGRSVRSHSPTGSEEEIMTYNGILKTSEVSVHYGERPRGGGHIHDSPQSHFD